MTRMIKQDMNYTRNIENIMEQMMEIIEDEKCKKERNHHP